MEDFLNAFEKKCNVTKNDYEITNSYKEDGLIRIKVNHKDYNSYQFITEDDYINYLKKWYEYEDLYDKFHYFDFFDILLKYYKISKKQFCNMGKLLFQNCFEEFEDGQEMLRMDIAPHYYECMELLDCYYIDSDDNFVIGDIISDIEKHSRWYERIQKNELKQFFKLKKYILKSYNKKDFSLEKLETKLFCYDLNTRYLISWCIDIVINIVGVNTFIEDYVKTIFFHRKSAILTTQKGEKYYCMGYISLPKFTKGNNK